ncbi:MAG: serine hydrolase domain-containing protein [Pseudomonadota bacterium]
MKNRQTFASPKVSLSILLLTALALQVTQTTAEAQQVGSTELDPVEAIFADFGRQGRPGVSVLVVKDGDVASKFNRGMADVAAQIPISHASVFNIGSVSKQFTVFGVLLLQEDGKLTLSDDIRRYIPELPDYGTTITLEHLARHTSGLRSQQYGALMGSWTQTDQRTHRQMLDLIRRQPKLLFEPGTRFSYSNAGTTLLAEVITRVSGIPFPEFMQRRIYEPLGMTSTSNRGEAARIIPDEVHSYYFEDSELKKALNPSGVQGYTNVYSTTRDLAKWVANFQSRSVGSAESLQAMLSATSLPSGRPIEHRMGLYVTPYRGYQQIQHTGSDRGYTSYLGWFPELNLTIVILANVEGIDVFGSAYAIADQFIAEDATPPPAVLSETQTQPPYFEISHADLGQFTGQYWNDAVGAVRRIELLDGRLYYVRSDTNRSPLGPIGPASFKMLDIEDDVTITFDVDQMTFEDQADAITFERIINTPLSSATLGQYRGLYVSDEVSAVYRVSACDGELVVSTAARDLLRFSRLNGDTFYSNGWFLRSIRFERNDDSQVTGFLGGNVGIQGVRFIKVTNPALPAIRYDECRQVQIPARG